MNITEVTDELDCIYSGFINQLIPQGVQGNCPVHGTAVKIEIRQILCDEFGEATFSAGGMTVYGNDQLFLKNYHGMRDKPQS